MTGKRGVTALAKRLNVKEGTLQNKLNPTCNEHEVMLREFRNILLHTNDMQPLHALCAEFNHVAMLLVNSDDVSDVALLEHLAQIDIERGEFMQRLKQSLADGQVYQAEYDLLMKEGMDVIRAWLEALHRLEGMVVNRGRR